MSNTDKQRVSIQRDVLSRMSIKPESGARMIAMGSAALTQGFALVGFETWANATEEQLDRVMHELLESKSRALVLLEPYLARCKCASLKKVREEGGRIVVTEVPPLEMPEDYHPEIEDLVLSVLGPEALGDAE